MPLPSPSAHPPRHSPLPSRPSCPQMPPEYGFLVSQPFSSLKKPSTKRKVPLTAECMATASTERIPEQPWGARAEGTLEPPEPGFCWPLPAGSLLSTRDHVVITKDSSGLPARNAAATAPTHPLPEGEDQSTGSQLALPNTSPCPAPAVPRQTDRPLPGRGPGCPRPCSLQGPVPQQSPSLGLRADRRRPSSLSFVDEGLQDTVSTSGSLVRGPPPQTSLPSLSSPSLV